jgi:hypothetical protein
MRARTRQVRLCRSFSSLSEYFDIRTHVLRTVFGLVAIHTGLLSYSAYVHGPTLNEPAHLVAGISHWRFQRFDLYSVNPPLIRLIAALPVLATGYNDDWSKYYAGPGIRAEMDVGADFISSNGTRSLLLLTIARWACIPFSWLGAFVCYMWARDLYGRPAGILACGIWCFEPTILAHGALITPDCHAASLGLAAHYCFFKWLKRPDWSGVVRNGFVLGLAELSKFTLIVFYPLWLVLWITYRLLANSQVRVTQLGREGSMLLVQIVISMYIINLGYRFEGSFIQLKDHEFVSDLFKNFASGPERKENTRSNEATIASAAPRSIRWFGNLYLPLPKDYLCGIDLQRRDFEDFGRPSYLRGSWNIRGWSYYYAYAVLVKLPCGTLLLAALVVANVVVGVFSNRSKVAKATLPQSLFRDELILMAPAIVIFVAVSFETGLNEHLRYVLPAFPYVFVYLSRVCRSRLSSYSRSHGPPSVICLEPEANSPRWSCRPILASVLVCWGTVSSLWIFPHNISYFNELVGGPNHGHLHLIHSNIDWGQDAIYLKKWLKANPTRDPVFIAYFGSFSLADIGVQFSPLPVGGFKQCLANRTKARYVISKNFIAGYSWNAIDGSGSLTRLGLCDLCAFGNESPRASVGYSINVYELGTDTLNATQAY